VAEDGTFYNVTELLEGFSLETLVLRFGPVPPERTVHFLRQVCHSLAEADHVGLYPLRESEEGADTPARLRGSELGLQRFPP
jgi:serine/threonine-protein kinase